MWRTVEEEGKDNGPTWNTINRQAAYKQQWSPLYKANASHWTGKTTVNRSEKSCLYLDIFRCVKINVFHLFFAFSFRLEMHVRCNNQYKTGADGGNSAWVSAF